MKEGALAEEGDFESAILFELWVLCNLLKMAGAEANGDRGSNLSIPSLAAS